LWKLCFGGSCGGEKKKKTSIQILSEAMKSRGEVIFPEERKGSKVSERKNSGKGKIISRVRPRTRS